MGKLVDKLLCPVCLENFSLFPDQPEEQNITYSKDGLYSHSLECSLPYSQCILHEGDLEVFQVSPISPTKELLYSVKVAETMSTSDEVPGNLIGWYMVFDEEELRDFRPCAFVPVKGGKTAGILVVRWKPCITWDFRAAKFISDSEQDRWCVDRIWVYAPYRHLGVATRTIEGAANFLGTKPADMGFSGPLSKEGNGLARALCGKILHVSH